MSLLRKLVFVPALLLAACGPSHAQLCARQCGDAGSCLAGTGFDLTACQSSCEANLEEDTAAVAYLECVYESDGTCMTGYEGCD